MSESRERVDSGFTKDMDDLYALLGDDVVAAARPKLTAQPSVLQILYNMYNSILCINFIWFGGGEKEIEARRPTRPLPLPSSSSSSSSPSPPPLHHLLFFASFSFSFFVKFLLSFSDNY